MKGPHPLLHPILIFIFSLMALCLSLFLYIHWYIKVTNNIEVFVTKFKLDKNLVSDPNNYLIIFITSILVACIMIGMAIIFSYYHKSQQLYRMQENFINNFTHELKTPLASIKLYLETFLKHQLDQQEQKKFIQYMLKDTQRLSLHVNQILQLASIENKSINYPLELEDTEKIIRQFLAQNIHLFQEGDIIFKNSDGPLVMPVNIPLFEILLINLLTNAFKYNHQRPLVEIEGSRKGPFIFLSFKDNGMGVETKHFRNIFKKFFQVGNSDNCTAKGSGLGLYLCQQIVKYHKGKIWVESSGPGRGSTFFMTFPIQRKLDTLKEKMA